MKPVFGKAATSAPKAASFIGTLADSVMAIVKATIVKALHRYTMSTTGFNNCASGVFRPKRNSRQGSAKYRTKALRPGMADSGSTRWRAAR